MKMILIRDRETGSVDAIVTAETTTEQDLNDILAGIILDVANGIENNSYLELLRERLPNDCKMTDHWSGDWKTVWY